MCRIFYSPSEDVEFNKTDLLRFFTQLEKSMGRDGNGIYLFNNNILDKSATNMPNTELEGSFLFHTRLATHGLKTDYNCQPFVGKRYILAHNGVFGNIEPYAQLLGFRGSDTKYSDSYMIHYIIEKTGILNFYLSFMDRYYGVILVHDKQLGKTFLLKSGGVFEIGELNSGDFIYGSSNIDFWQLKNIPLSLGSGLYRLEKDGYTQLHTPTTYGWTARKTQSQWIPPTTNDNKDVKFCEWCYEEFEDDDTRYEDYGYVLCRGCYYCYTDRDFPDESSTTDVPRGIGSLFGGTAKLCYECEIPLKNIGCHTTDNRVLCVNCYKEWIDIKKKKKKKPNYFNNSVPKKCYGCNWLKNFDCYFGGVKNKDFESTMDEKTGLSACNTKTHVISIGMDCHSCEHTIEKDDNWKLYNNSLVLCMDCYNAIKEHKIEEPIPPFMPDKCGECGYHFEDGDQIIEDTMQNIYICDACEKYTFNSTGFERYMVYKRKKTDDEHY